MQCKSVTDYGNSHTLTLQLVPKTNIEAVCQLQIYIAHHSTATNGLGMNQVYGTELHGKLIRTYNMAACLNKAYASLHCSTHTCATPTVYD